MEQPDLKSLMQLLKSPAGQQLIAYLKTQDGSAARTAAAQANAGDMAAARDTLAPLMRDPRFREILEQLGGKP